MLRISQLGLVILSVAPVLLAAAACGDDDPSSPPAVPDDIRYELQPWTRELDPEALAAVADVGLEDGRMRFKGAPTKLAGLKKDDVLVAGKSATTPSGILRQVLEVKSEGGDMLVVTRPVPVQLAFKSLHARVTTKATKLNGAPADPTPAGSVSGKALHSTKIEDGDGVGINWRVFDQDKNEATKDDQLYVKGGAHGSVTITAWIDLDWLDDPVKVTKEHLCFAAFPACVPDLPNVVMGAKVEANAFIGVDAEGAASTGFVSEEIPITNSEFELTEITVGPVLITPTVDFVAQISGSANARFHTGVGIKYGVSTEASMSSKTGPSFTPPTIPKPEYQPPVVEVSLTSDVKVSVGPRLTVFFWKTFGPTFSIKAFANVHANSEQTPCWNVSAGADASIGIRFRIPWKVFGLSEIGKLLNLDGDILNKSYPFNIFEVPNIVSGACGPLPVNVYPPGEGPSDEVYKSPTFAPWSKRYLDFSTTFPHTGEISEANLHTAKTIDGAWLVSGKGIQGVMKLSENGDVVWAKKIHLPTVGDEPPVGFDEAKSAFAVQALDTNIWVASSRFTVMKVDQDGDLVWANRYRPGAPNAADKDLPSAIGPTGVVTLADGGAIVQYGVEDTSSDGPAVILRLDKSGKLLWSKTFKWETPKTFAPVLVADGDEVTLAGSSWESGAQKAHVARLRADGSVAWAKTMSVCDNTRVRPSYGVRLGSKAVAIIGTYDLSPERAFLAQISPDGANGTLSSWWTNENLKDDRTNGVAQLPVTGFLTAGIGAPTVGYSLLLAQHDAQGTITSTRELLMTEGAGRWDIRPGALRMTNDGGALIFTHVTTANGFTGPARSGLWVSKLPARTFDGPFNPALVQPGTQAATPTPACSLVLGPDTLAPTDMALETVNVTSSIKIDPLAPVVEKMIP